MRYNQNLFSVTFKPHFQKKKKNPAKQALSIFCNSLQYALHPCCNFLFLFGLTNARKCERSLSLRTFTVFNWTSAPEKLPFWPERDVIGHDLVSYPTWRRPMCELRYLLPVIYSVICFNEDWRYQFTRANNFCLLELKYPVRWSL